MTQLKQTIKTRFYPKPVPGLLSLDGWRDFESAYRSKAPIRYFLYRSIPLKWGRFQNSVRNLYWSIRHRVDPRHRYHIVNTGLPPGYYDKDELILHSCFSLLSRFVEAEKPGEEIDWNSDEHHKKAWSEIKELYAWWKEVRPKRHLSDPYEAGNREAVLASLKFDQDNDAEDTRQLHRLMDVRGYLWT